MPPFAVRAKRDIFLKARQGKRWGFPQLPPRARRIPGLGYAAREEAGPPEKR